MMIRTLLFSGFLGITLIANAQQPALAGKWKGFLTQEGLETKFTSSYGFELDLTQQGGYLKGSSRISAGEKWGRMNLVGATLNTMVSLHDISLAADNLNGQGVWCIKYLMLTYDAQRGILSGQWFSDGCGAGMIEVSRVK